MIHIDNNSLAAGFAIFCRIGVCLSFAPGFSSSRILMRLRLLIAIGLTVALAPSVIGEIKPGTIDLQAFPLASLIVGECLIGAAIGVMARMIFGCLEMMLTAASMAIGASSSFAPRVDDSETLPEFASIVAFATAALLFVVDLHWEIVRAVFDSYVAMPMGVPVGSQFIVARIGETLSLGLSVAFRLASPFIAFGVISNFAFALINKITPQVALYFVSTPFVLVGGLALLHLLWADISIEFLAFFRNWLERL